MIKIGFTGDFCPWLRVEERYKKQDWQSLFADVHSFFTENDLNIFNLECPLTSAETKIEKTGPHLKVDPETVGILNHLNCKLVATANNHFMDYGVEGVNETYQTLQKNNIDWFGSGNNFEEASKIFYWEEDNLKFAFINVAENEWATTYGDYPGCNPIDLVNVFNQIQEAKAIADFVIVVAHGGHENYELPSPRMKKWYRFFVDAGASAVISHHTHIISGHEIYKDAPIFYSLGNFCFDWEGTKNMPWNKGMIVKLKFEKNKKIEFETVFFRQNEDKLGIYKIEGEEGKILQNHLKEISLIIVDDKKLDLEFERYSKKWEPLINTWIQPYQGKILPSLFKKGLLPSLINKKKKLLLTNLIRCEAHRDILLNAMSSK